MKINLIELLGIANLYASRTRVLLVAYFLVSLILVFVGAILFAGHTTRKMERHSEVLTKVFSLFISETAFNADRPGNFEVIREIVGQVPFPLIITDAKNIPLVWRGIDVAPSEAEDPLELARSELTTEQLKRRERLRAYIEEFDAHEAPVPILSGDIVQAYVHFGPSDLSRQLTWMPWVLLLALGVFSAFGLMGVRSMKRSEQRSIWVGMARETAHQLGTPLTSLMGWLHLLQFDDQSEVESQTTQAWEKRCKTYEEMEHDLQRLSKVSERFSKIGSSPDLSPIELAPILENTVGYIRRRTPHLGAQVRMTSDLQEVPKVLANLELIEWVMENLLKNSLDALQNGGEIHVTLSECAQAGYVEVRVADNGKGVPKALRQRIWEPGFSTKKRGWGLGLSLVRRIIEEYHGGRIWLEDNASRQGICFAIRLPTGSGA